MSKAKDTFTLQIIRPDGEIIDTLLLPVGIERYTYKDEVTFDFTRHNPKAGDTVTWAVEYE